LMCFSTLSTCSHLMIHILFNFNKLLKNIFFKSRNEDKANGSMRKCNFFIVTRMGKNQKMMALSESDDVDYELGKFETRPFFVGNVGKGIVWG